MDKNFQILNDFKIFDNQKDIFNSIDTLEKMIKEKDLEYFGNKMRKLLENIFNITPEISVEGFLHDKIKDLINKNSVPTNVKNGIFSIKTLVNRESHDPKNRKSDALYIVKISLSESKIAMRDLWLFIKWVAINFKNINDLEKYEFNNNEEKNNIPINLELSNNNDDMDAEKLTMAQLIFSKGFKFNIPTYQRDYTWDIKNIKKLIDDMEKRIDDTKTHYFGSFAIAIDKEEKIFRIIDGQQRITTSLLLLKAFYEVMKKNDMIIPKELLSFVENDILDIYINQDILSSQRAVSLILKNLKKDITLNQQPFKNYEYIYENFLLYNKEKIYEMYTVFASKIEISTLIFNTTLDNEMDIFENLNTGGMKLSNWDLIRSYIFSRVDQKYLIKDEKVINKMINETFLIPLNHELKGKPFKSSLEAFFAIYNRYYMAINNKLLKTKEVYEDFKKIWINSQQKFKNLKEFQMGISELSKIYNIFLQLRYKHKHNESKLHSYSHILSLVTTRDDLFPVVISAVEQYCELSETGVINKIHPKFIKVIRILESYLIKSNVYGNGMQKDFDEFIIKHNNTIVENLYKYLKNNMQISFANNEEFRQTLSSSGSLRKGKILSIITHLELKIRGVKQGSSGFQKFEKTHEHILAQKLSYSNYDDKSLTSSEFKELLNSKKDSIGNALLLSLGDNSLAGNKKFSDKLSIYKSSSFLALGTDKPIIMNLLEKDTFTFEDINTRSKQIADYVIDQKIYYEEG